MAHRICLFIICLSHFLHAQDATEKALFKLIDPKDCSSIYINIRNDQLTKKSSNDDVIMVHMSVKTNIPRIIVDQLIKAGRYNIESGKDGDTFIVRVPNLEKAILIRDKPLLEEISIHVQTPGYFSLDNGVLQKDINEEVIAARSANDEQAKKMLMEMKHIKEKIDWQIEVTTSSSYEEEIKLSSFELVVDGVLTTMDKLRFID